MSKAGPLSTPLRSSPPKTGRKITGRRQPGPDLAVYRARVFRKLWVGLAQEVRLLDQSYCRLLLKLLPLPVLTLEKPGLYLGTT